MLKTADFKTCAQIQPKRGWCFVRKLFLCVFFCLFPIFSFSATLPSGYTELEYIESTGTQYIDTGVVPANGFGFDIDVMPLTNIDTESWAMVLGSSNFNSGRWGGVLLGTWPPSGLQGQATWFRREHWYDPGFVAYTRCTMKNVNNHFTSSTGKDYDTPYSTNTEISGNLYLFAIHSDQTVHTGAGVRMYSCKLYSGSTVVRDFIPAKRNSDNVVGLYDTVNNIFYTNSGTGSFIAGPVVETYTELEYLELQGEAYFNTNVYLSKDMDIEFELMPTQLENSGTFGLARSVQSGGFQFSYNIDYVVSSTYTANNTLVDFFGTATTARWIIQQIGSSDNGYIIQNNKKYKLSIVDKIASFSVDGVIIDTHTYVADGTSPSTVPFYINAKNHLGDVTYVNGDLHVRFYHFSATGVADIVPVKRNSDNALGLYNKITGEFLEKIGSGTLVAGPAVDDPGVSEPSCEYTRLEYLKSSDAQYIQDNSFQPISTGAIEIKTKDLQTYTRFAGWDGLVALATPNSVTNYFPFLYGSWDDYNPNPVSIAAENALRYEFEPGLQKLYVNGVFNRQAQKNTSISSAPFRIFIVSTGGGYNHGSTIYYCRVYDANNVLLRNYVPVKRNSDNVLGMYDTVTGTFFTNKGSGTFTAGPEIVSGDICSTTITIHWDGLSEPEASGMCVYGETFTAPSTAPTAPSGLKFLGWIPR